MCKHICFFGGLYQRGEGPNLQPMRPSDRRRATGCERKSHGSNFFAGVHTTCVDGRATTRHLHGRVQLTVRYATVKVSAESADAVSR